MVGDESIGEKIQKFYVSLRSSNDIAMIIDSLNTIEEHVYIEDIGETSEIIAEIKSDCQRKCAQFIRAPYADTARNIIAASRKRLVLKASVDVESSHQHSQRHLNTLLDLLGTWSNCIEELTCTGLSKKMMRIIIAPLHSRVIEMALDCFEKFKEDKKLDSWHIRIMESNDSQSTAVSVASLDFLLSQMSAMREIVNQYSRFVVNRVALTDSENLKGDTACCDDDDNIITTSEKNRWRELDAVYISLEFGYLNFAISDALSACTLLEVERNINVPQAIEDMFFLLQRVVERSLSTGSESVALAVGNKIVESVDPQQEAQLYALMQSQAVFRDSYHNKEINLNRRHALSGSNAPSSPSRLSSSRSTESLSSPRTPFSRNTSSGIVPGLLQQSTSTGNLLSDGLAGKSYS